MLEHEDFVVAAILEEGRFSKEALDNAVREGARSRLTPSQAIVAKGLLSSREMAIVKAVIAEVPFVDTAQHQIDIRNSARLPKATAESLRAFPLFDLGEVVTVGMADPLDLRAVDQLRAMLRAEVETVMCEPESLARLIERAYALSGSTVEEEAPSAAPAGVSLTTGREPIVAAVNQILAQAIERSASDIHIGPDDQTLHLRFRIDGHLRTQQGPSLSAHSGIVQRIKVMAGLDLTQNRRPQDGKFRFTADGRQVDVRVSIIPTVTGENVVMRLLTSAGSIKGFADLGLLSRDCEMMERMLESPNGMVLVTGPTGSGKTTTLYTALKKLNSPELNIMTIEDPVEVRMPMIRQVQTNAEIGMTFAGALRSMLRQDPDVVLVGEIRDEETARIAVQAALTGHLVLSSLHTSDACGAVPRLIDLGCPTFAINAALVGAIGQRLVRRVCPDCAAPVKPDPMLLARLPDDGAAATYVEGGGCARCAGLGFKGRIGVYEVLVMTAAVRRAVDQRAGAAALRRAARDEGMTPMWADGLAKARMGLTTIGEVVSAAAAADEELGEPAAGPGPEGARPTDKPPPGSGLPSTPPPSAAPAGPQSPSGPPGGRKGDKPGKRRAA